MEVSVRRLNHRLALQLPRELPLGLVFVAGVAGDVARIPVARKGNGRTSYVQFDLTENNYRLRCVVPPREAAHATLAAGARVRVGGHLMFDPGRADYFLLARDVEVVGQTAVVEPPDEDARALRLEQEALALELERVKRRAKAARLAKAELPEWVQKIAPPEVREARAREEEKEPEPEVEELLAATAVAADLDEELVEALAEAMDSEEEVEVTADMLAQYDVQPEQPFAPAEADTVVFPPLPKPRYALPSDHHETDWLVILLIIAFFVMAVAMIIASILLILQ